MITRQWPRGFMVALALTIALVLGPGFTPRPAEAASEDVAMFYDDLSQYGQWVEYDKYGPVWRPSQVPEDWRPYTNGRWVPTNDGNVFESEEPWGWATYHYGNWMPTEGNGWVWVPGRTWYPATVEWRTSPESEPVESSYIGWAPTPPPDYEPPPSFAPPSYYQGAPVTDALTAPLWIFARAASFLLGLGQPYTPAYSYIGSGILMPPAYVPVFFGRTVFIPAYAQPTYYPPAFFGGRRFGAGYYNRGPSVAYISRVTNINQTIINRTSLNNSNRLNGIHNVMPPDRVMRGDGYIRNIMPPALVQGHRLPPPNPVQNVRMAQANLNKPNLVPVPRDVPRITGNIPRVQPAALTPGHGLPGTALPAGATMPLTPQMTQQIQNLPPQQRFVPGTGRPFTPAAATQPGPKPAQPGAPAQPGQFQPGAQTSPGQPGAVTKPGERQPGPAKPGEFHPGAVRPGTTPVVPPATTVTPGAAKSGAVPRPPGEKGLTPEQRRQQEQEHQRLQRGGAPGQQGQQPGQAPRQQEERQRQQQLQQQRQQQQGQQERQRQQQLQRQQQQQQRQQQIQQQQQRQQQERQRQQQIQQRQQQQRQPQQQQQQQKKEEQKKKEQQQ